MVSGYKWDDKGTWLVGMNGMTKSMVSEYEWDDKGAW